MTRQNARREVRQTTVRLHASPERVFPLLCPVREHDWLPGWEARVIFSESGFAEEGCVFTTTDEAGREAVWTVSAYVPEKRIEFAVVIPGHYVTTLHIELHPDGDGTEVDWRRTYTALSREGARAIAAITPEGFAAHIARLGRQLDHYLSTGTQLHL
jgi:hypothetical protein